MQSWKEGSRAFVLKLNYDELNYDLVIVSVAC